MRYPIIALTAAVLAASLGAVPCRAGEVDDWLALAAGVASQDSPSPAAALQAESTVRRALRRALKEAGPDARARDLAAAEAAHRVLVELFPQRRALFDAQLESAELRLGRVAHGKTAIPAGRAAGAEALSISWPRAVRPRADEPPPAKPEVELPTPPRTEAPLMQVQPPPGDPPPWSNPHAVSL